VSYTNASIFNSLSPGVSLCGCQPDHVHDVCSTQGLQLQHTAVRTDSNDVFDAVALADMQQVSTCRLSAGLYNGAGASVVGL
jgi:hypothetical protein